MLDCKGGPDARVKAKRTRLLLYGAGARRVAIWPDEARLSLWDVAPGDLAVLLYQMIDSGTGAAAYYADILQAVLTLAVTAPGGPPPNGAAFLGRLEAKWLQYAWGDGRHPEELARVRAAARHLPDIRLRFATLLGRLGPALDGPGDLAECDAWYCILEGTSEPSVAEAQALAITELAARAATGLAGEPRAMLLAADDYSAVSRRVPLSNLYERGRSLGIGVQVSAQSWQGLGRDDDERYRIAATADGGIWVLGTPRPEPLSGLAGHRRVLDTAHRLVGNAWGDEGLTREQRGLGGRSGSDPAAGYRAGLLHPPRRGHLCPGGPAHAVAAEPACRSAAGRCARAAAGKHAGNDAAGVARTRAARRRATSSVRRPRREREPVRGARPAGPA